MWHTPGHTGVAIWETSEQLGCNGRQDLKYQESKMTTGSYMWM